MRPGTPGAGSARVSEAEIRIPHRLLSAVVAAYSVLVGLWDGHFTRWLRTRFACVMALDRSAAMLGEARRLTIPAVSPMSSDNLSPMCRVEQ